MIGDEGMEKMLISLAEWPLDTQENLPTPYQSSFRYDSPKNLSLPLYTPLFLMFPGADEKACFICPQNHNPPFPKSRWQRSRWQWAPQRCRILFRGPGSLNGYLLLRFIFLLNILPPHLSATWVPILQRGPIREPIYIFFDLFIFFLFL